VLAPYGEYLVEVYALGFSHAWRLIRIAQAETIMRVELKVGYLGCPDPLAAIGGHIQRNGHDEELWVKAISVRGTGGGEARVSHFGYFLISGLEHSTYLVLVMEREKVLHQRVLTAGIHASQLTIDLGGTR
jgi:hypothetical protein